MRQGSRSNFLGRVISDLSRIELTNPSLFGNRLLRTRECLICSHVLDRCSSISVHLRVMFRRGRQSLWHRNTSTWRYAYRHSSCTTSSFWRATKLLITRIQKVTMCVRRSHSHLQLLQNIISSPVPGWTFDTSFLSFFKFTSRMLDVVMVARLSLHTASWGLINERGKGLNWVNPCDPRKVTR